MTDDAGVGAFGRATGRDLEDDGGVHRRRYRAFQFELISRHCGPTVLEVGAGLGEFAAQFTEGQFIQGQLTKGQLTEGQVIEGRPSEDIPASQRLVVTDVDPGCVASMAARFADRPEVEAHRLDLVGEFPELGAPVSTVVAINVLEHVEDDSGALRRLAGLVEPGGSIVLWVPGYMQLYGEFDRQVGHVRRYTPRTLRAAIEGAGLTCADVRPVNLLGAAAWWLAVRHGGVGSPRPGLLRIYDGVVVPVTRAVESVVRPPFGQSVLAVATVP